MSNTLQYKDYTGSVDFSAEDNVFFGKINDINDVVLFEGTSVGELKANFEEAVDDYLETCQATGKTPEKAFTGSFNIRLQPELHRILVHQARESKVSLNHYVQKILNVAAANPSLLNGGTRRQQITFVRPTSKAHAKAAAKSAGAQRKN